MLIVPIFSNIFLVPFFTFIFGFHYGYTTSLLSTFIHLGLNCKIQSSELHCLKTTCKTKVCHKLCYSARQTVSQISKSSSCKKVFPKCVYHWYNLLLLMLFIPRVFERHYFLHKFIVTQSFGETVNLLCSFKQIFWRKSAFYIRYLHNNITMLPIPKLHNKSSTL